jgi:hypothetical protein
MSIIGKVISGGQTGADMAGLLAARKCGIPTGGTAPKGYLTENGPRPELAEFGLVEHTSSNYPPRTRKNVKDSDLTLIITPRQPLGRGSDLTRRLCLKMDRPVFILTRYTYPRPAYESVISFIEYVANYKTDKGDPNPLTFNIAGSAESKAPGLEEQATEFLVSLFRELALDD